MFCQLWNGMIQRGLSTWGIQIGSFAAVRAPFVVKYFKLFHLHAGEANSYYPSGPIMGKGSHPTLKLDETEDFKCQGLLNWTICKPLHL